MDRKNAGRGLRKKRTVNQFYFFRESSEQLHAQHVFLGPEKNEL